MREREVVLSNSVVVENAPLGVRNKAIEFGGNLLFHPCEIDESILSSDVNPIVAPRSRESCCARQPEHSCFPDVPHVQQLRVALIEELEDHRAPSSSGRPQLRSSRTKSRRCDNAGHDRHIEHVFELFGPH
jgi:hypothetical protein